MYSFFLSLFYAGGTYIALSLLIVEILLAFRTFDLVQLVFAPRIAVIVTH